MYVPTYVYFKKKISHEYKKEYQTYKNMCTYLHTCEKFLKYLLIKIHL